jgi:hypothetical protein
MPKGRIGMGGFDADNIANTIVKTQAALRREAAKRFSGGNAKGAYKFKKSKGASASAGRFGMDEPATGSRRPRPGTTLAKPAFRELGRVKPGSKAPRKQMPKMYKRGK